ncbi:MAG: T9SS type A sorting domain-containing protein [Saprospiraceae bacterium]|nr:T9SS type A sorting domain-containing protein [Saprospiraceae bacterium]
MRQFFIPPFLAFIATFSLNAQPPGCPNGFFTLSSQAQVDNFPVIHPDCHNLSVKMLISGSDIENLDGLSGIFTTANSIEIIDNPMLSSLSGLSNLTSIGVEFKLNNNDALPNLSGLENLSWIGGHFLISGNAVLTTLNGLGPIPSLGSYLYVGFNPLLTDISALNTITEIGPDYFNAFLVITHNNSLTSISGLNLVSETGSYLSIDGNAQLSSISGLNGLHTVNGNFSITDNPSLTDISGFNSLSTVNGQWSLDNNNALASTSGFPSLLTVADNFIISSCSSLGSLTNFSSEFSIGGTLAITNNISLSECEALAICNHLDANKPASISGNATGCHDIDAVEDACLLLPVELTHFGAKQTTQGILLYWQTASEKDDAYFEIEHSTAKNKDFLPIGRVAGNGTTSSVSHYEYLHRQPAPGDNYYRLKQVDFNGTFSCSDIVRVCVKNNDELGLHPNPTRGPVFVKGDPNGFRTAQVSDAAGRPILNVNLTENNLIDLSGQPQGVYFVEILTEHQKTVRRVVVE